MNRRQQQKIDIYYLEFKDIIKFYNMNNNNIIILDKKINGNYERLQKAINSKKFNFINILK